jgi:GntR family transcriptional regulator
VDNGYVPEPVKTDNRPLYTRAIDAVTRLIAEGQYHSGDMLPREEDLARRLGISRSTLRVALGHLETHGLISRRPGVGTFIAAAAPARTGFMGALDRMETLTALAEVAGERAEIVLRQVDLVEATADVAGELGLAAGSSAARIEVVEALNGRRGAYFDTFIPAELVDINQVRAFDGDMIQYLARFPELMPAHTRSEILVEPGCEQVRAMVGLTGDRWLLHLRETFFNARGRAVAFSYNYFLTDVFHFYLIRRVIVKP